MNADPGPTVVCQPPWWRVGMYAGIAFAVAAVAASGVLDGPGTLLLAVLAGGAAGLAGRDAALRPTLQADTAALRVRDGVRLSRVAWAAVTALSVRSVSRRGLVGLRSLEIDLLVSDPAGGPRDHLVVLSRRALGADPERVVESLERLRRPDRHGGGKIG